MQNHPGHAQDSRRVVAKSGASGERSTTAGVFGIADGADHGQSFGLANLQNGIHMRPQLFVVNLFFVIRFHWGSGLGCSAACIAWLRCSTIGTSNSGGGSCTTMMAQAM